MSNDDPIMSSVAAGIFAAVCFASVLEVAGWVFTPDKKKFVERVNKGEKDADITR